MTKPTTVDTNLLAYATDVESRAVEAVNRLGSYRAAAKELGWSDADGARKAIKRLEGRAARLGYAPNHWDSGVAAGYLMGKVTVQRGPDGVERTWERMSPDSRQQALFMEAAAEALKATLDRVAPLPIPSHTVASLLNLYTLTDCHVGMLAWRHEGGEDWDLKIAEDTLYRSFEQMVQVAPPAKVGVVNQLGDFLHTDGMTPITPTGHNVLDADGRFSKMVSIAIRLLRRMVDLALLKHEEVVVLLAEGNHDMASSIWLRVMFKALYENEPRVTVIESALPYYALEHGKTMLAFHHGHLKKPDQLAPVMAAQFAPIWGRTSHRYAHMGHMHSLYEREHNGMIVTQHPTLAARDAYAARGGWFADRAASVITYHNVYGQVAKSTVTPEMLV